MKKAFISTGSIVLILIGAGLIYIAPHFSEPKFIIINNTNQTIKVTAEWRNNRKELGKLEKGTSTEFHVRDEASMKITAVLENGNKFFSQPVYFTSGLVYNFTINENDIISTFN